MPTVRFCDEQAAIDLFRGVLQQAQKDLVQKMVKPQDRVTAKVFLESMALKTAQHKTTPKEGAEYESA